MKRPKKKKAPHAVYELEPPRYVYGPRPLKGRKGMTKRSYWRRREPGMSDSIPNPTYKDAPYKLTTKLINEAHEKLRRMGRKL